MPDVSTPISLLAERAKRDSVEEFKHHMERAMLFRQKRRNRIYALTRAIRNGIENGLYVEFGVADGAGSRLFSKLLRPHGLTMTGFDSFEGLEEDWTGIPTGRAVGAFSRSGELPEVPDNIALVKGKVQDTLPGYLEDTASAPFAFVHMDMDTYTPTAFALEAIKPRLTKGTVILFDELYGYPGWRHHEYTALREALDPDTYAYISFATEAVAIEMMQAP